MNIDALAHELFFWVTRYIAGFCLVSIALWGGGVLLWGKDSARRVRDSSIFLGAIGVLTLMLALRPDHAEALLWQPITWFCFALLVMLEFFWLSYLLEAIVLYLRGMAMARAAHGKPGSPAPPHYHFPSI